MSQRKEEKLVWAAGILRKAQDNEEHCSITFHVRGGDIYKAEHNQSFVPPGAGVPVKQTGG